MSNSSSGLTMWGATAAAGGAKTGLACKGAGALAAGLVATKRGSIVAVATVLGAKAAGSELTAAARGWVSDGSHVSPGWGVRPSASSCAAASPRTPKATESRQARTALSEALRTRDHIHATPNNAKTSRPPSAYTTVAGKRSCSIDASCCCNRAAAARSWAACERSAAVSDSSAFRRSPSFCSSSGCTFKDFHTAAACVRAADASSDGGAGSWDVDRNATGPSSEVSRGSTTRRERTAGAVPAPADLPGAAATTRAAGFAAAAEPVARLAAVEGRAALAGAAALSRGRVPCAIPAAAAEAAAAPPPTEGTGWDSVTAPGLAAGSRERSTGEAEADRVTVVGNSDRKV